MAPPFRNIVPLCVLVLLAGCNSNELLCDSGRVIASVNEISQRNENSLYAKAKAALPSLHDETAWEALNKEGKQIRDKISDARTRCSNWSMVCQDMSTTPTLEAFRQINYNGSRPVTSAEVEYYRANFLPLFDQFRSLLDKQKLFQDEVQRRQEAQAADFDKSVRYELDTIRPKLRNEQTGAIVCEARVTIFASTGSWYREILYSAEKTTDGKIFVRVQRSN